jgi:gamma-glutamylcyclotransferase (GGCT)/AIG2-like uncharacterized protein YtfP
MQSRQEHLFSYGTLQNTPVQFALFGRTLQGSKDALSGYTVSTIEITDKVFLARGEEKLQSTLVQSADRNDKIRGTVFAVTAIELQTADRYEPVNYKRKKVVLDSGIEAWIYVASNEPEETIY